MKKVSLWAKDHVIESRILIVIFYILLNVIGVYTGKLFREINVILPELYFTICLIITTFLWIAYPTKYHLENGMRKTTSYFHRKIFDLSLATITFLMIVYAGNNWKNLFVHSEPAQATRIVRITKDSALINNPLIKNFISLLKNTDLSKLSTREKIKLVRDQVKKIRHDQDTPKKNKTGLIIISILVALALIAGVAALSCSIGCAGSEALAAIVAVVGIALIIFLLIKVIKRINHPRTVAKE